MDDMTFTTNLFVLSIICTVVDMYFKTPSKKLRSLLTFVYFLLNVGSITTWCYLLLTMPDKVFDILMGFIFIIPFSIVIYREIDSDKESKIIKK